MDAKGLDIGRERIEAATVIWAAGIKASELNRDLSKEQDRLGRVTVDADLGLPGYPEIFVAGDQARCLDRNGEPLPGVAPVALQQGRHVARNILAEIGGEARRAFSYFDKGQMSTVGRSRAIVEMGPLRFTGFFAWITWLVVHIYFLTGFKNRLFVVLQWATAYFTFTRGARLIVDRDWRFYPEADGKEERAA